MESSEITEKDRVDYHYQEYVRLCSVCDDYTKSAFGDIKLLGSIGGFMAWEPLSKFIVGKEGISESILLAGFIAILLMIMFLLFFDLLKQSVLHFYLMQAQHHEEILGDKLDTKEFPAFQLIKKWPYWAKEVHMPLALKFFTVVYLFLLVFPTVILANQGPLWWPMVYASVAVILLAAHGYSTYVVANSLTTVKV